MSQTKEIRNKIGSVQNTMKITSAMELVASSKMKKTQDAMKKGKPYSKKIVELYDNLPNEIYIKWKNEFLSNFGVALSNVINVIDPDVVVLGGGLSNINFLYNEGISSVQKNIFSNKKDTPIIPNELGDSAGVFGAALLN